MELLKDADNILDSLLETEVETYGEVNVRFSIPVNLISHLEVEI